MGIFNTRTVMTNAKVWERHGNQNACRLCGQFIQNQEEYYMIYHPKDRNFLVHADEWDSFKAGMTDEEVFEKLQEVKKPRPENQSCLPEYKIEAFKRVLAKKRYLIKKETSNRIYFKISQEVAQFFFDKKFGFIEFTGKGNGLFDRMVIREVQSRLFEAWKEELGETAEEGFRVEKVVAEAINKVNEIIK